MDVKGSSWNHQCQKTLYNKTQIMEVPTAYNYNTKENDRPAIAIPLPHHFH